MQGGGAHLTSARHVFEPWFFTWFKPHLNWSSNLNQNSSVWKSDHCLVGCSVGGRGSRRVSVGGEEGVCHISVAPKPASREDFDRFFISISEQSWHWGTSNFDFRAIYVIDDFPVRVKRIWSPTRFLSRLHVLRWGPSLLSGQGQSGFSEVLKAKKKY